MGDYEPEKGGFIPVFIHLLLYGISAKMSIRLREIPRKKQIFLRCLKSGAIEGLYRRGKKQITIDGKGESTGECIFNCIIA